MVKQSFLKPNCFAFLGIFKAKFHIIVTQVIYTEQPVHFFVYSIFKSYILFYWTYRSHPSKNDQM